MFLTLPKNPFGIQNLNLSLSGTNSIQQNDDAYEARINKLFVVPEYLETKNKSMTEDMLSEQLLTGHFIGYSQ